MEAYLHQITEPNGQLSLMFSQSPNNPWSHWLASHREKCAYVVTPLYPDPGGQIGKLRQALLAIIERADSGGRRLETAMQACEDIEVIGREALGLPIPEGLK